MTADSSTTVTLCDAHVHIHDCFDLGRFFDSAWINFQDAARRHGAENNFSAALLLTETMRDQWFAKLSEASATRHTMGTDWEFRATGESESLLARRDDGREILIVAGRQIVTAENLEVLAPATTAQRPDGEPIANVVDWVQQVGGVPVIPWGFGKWWGKRGQILFRLLGAMARDQLFLGDNAGRPWFLNQPRHFLAAQREKRRVLPGSDPLPFRWEASRPGSAGFSYRGALDTPAPARRIRDQLLDPHAQIDTYIRCERLLPFVRNQIAMQVRKRLK